MSVESEDVGENLSLWPLGVWSVGGDASVQNPKACKFIDARSITHQLSFCPQQQVELTLEIIQGESS